MDMVKALNPSRNHGTTSIGPGDCAVKPTGGASEGGEPKTSKFDPGEDAAAVRPLGFSFNPFSLIRNGKFGAHDDLLL